ncbi:MAG: hypothetical protein ACJAZH_000219 [Roseivirga sp.]|jgi:uncharacterized protein (TIGR02231 family)
MRTLLFAFLICSSLNAQIIDALYPVSAVKVYQQGAQVERALHTDLQVGVNTIIFKGLSNDLDPNSIQLRGLQSINLISISQSRLTSAEIEQHPSLTKLKKEIVNNRQLQRSLNDEKEGLLLERKYLESNTNIGGSEGYNLIQLREISKYVREERSANAKANSKLDLELLLLRNEMQEIEKILRDEISALSSTSTILSMLISSTTSQKADLTLSYQVSAAGWSSTYDLKVNSLSKPVNLLHKAIIYQNTGEDWEKVKLELNTGSMNANGQIPALYPTFLYPLPIYVDGIRADKMPTARAYHKLKPSENREMDRDKSVSASSQNTISTNLLSRTYLIAERVSINTGKREINLLRELEIPAIYEYQSIPKLAPSAFLIAKVYDWSNYNLEEGEIALYNEGNYIGKSYLDPKVSVDTLALSLGKDADIIVEREKLKEESGNTFLGSKKTAKFVYEIKVLNKKNTGIKLVLIDQIPVAQHEDIKVEIAIDPLKASNLNQGKIIWKLSIPAKGQVTKRLEYKISYPKEMRINH